MWFFGEFKQFFYRDLHEFSRNLAATVDAAALLASGREGEGYERN